MSPLRFSRFILFSAFMLSLFFPRLAIAEEKQKYSNWTEIAQAMEISLNKAYDAYFQKDIEEGKKWVNDAYFGYYEKEGFERTVMSYISGKRGSTVEYQFVIIKKMMNDQKPNKEIRTAIDDLIKWLKEDAHQLDGTEESGWSVFIASLIIILREGVEAILVIAAMAAYLSRSGNQTQTKIVYQSAVAAIGASILAAFGLQYIFKISGAQQEILEGITMLLATVVLFFVSHWMLSKSEAAAWNQYVQDKVKTAIATGSSFALGAAAFLAVFREGAETILFYQAMMADVQNNTHMIWIGFAVGCFLLVIVFAIVRFGSLKLPLKPFFTIISILMYIMAIAFAGGGVKELQEGDLIGVTPLPYITSIDILGIYPTVETLLPQVILVVLAIISAFYYRMKPAHMSAQAH